MATRVRKTAVVAPAESVPETTPAQTTRRRAATSRTATTRRTASSSRSQRIAVGTDPAPPAAEPSSEALPVNEAVPVPEAVPAIATPVESPVATPNPAESKSQLAAATPFVQAERSEQDFTSVMSARVDSIHKLVAEGQDRLSQEISKSQTQTVRNVSGLAHDVDRLMTQLQGMSARIAQTESVLSRIEATLVPLSRAISASLLPIKPVEKGVSPELLESRLATALAPILAELIEMRAQRSRDSSLAQVEQQILLTELKRLRSVALPAAERTTDPLLSVGKTSRRGSAK
ncbi:MAG: hypothetical protein JNM40_05280 [Myxococcales bacterium]|nr:hypothetical protein [Myxococcales bacterium]